jgi:hypothetical protein
METAGSDPEARWPSRRAPPELLAHPCGARQVLRAVVTSARVPALGGLATPEVAWGRGSGVRLEIEVDRIDRETVIAGAVVRV